MESLTLESRWLCKCAMPHLRKPWFCAEFQLLADSAPSAGMENLKHASGGASGLGAAVQAQVLLLPCTCSPLH